jgi:hypothetical protein
MRPSEPLMESDQSIRRVFLEGFTASDIAQPLRSFDRSAPAKSVREIMLEAGCEVAGIRDQGVVTGFVELASLTDGCCGDYARPIDDSLLVEGTLPLAPLVLRLKEQPRLFVAVFGQPCGVVSRWELQHPAARMWLFGVVSLIEMRFVRMIEQYCPGGAWRTYLSAGRLSKAESLLAERCRRNRQLTLIDCLQFSDKTTIIGRNDELRSLTRFSSRSQIEEVGKRLEKLRNNLAHSQDIITSDWETIVALAENLESILDGPPGARRS